MAKKKRSDWHVAFESIIRILFKGIKGIVIKAEVKLGTGAPRADFLIIQNKAKTKNPLFSIFREYNVIEYKSPHDELNARVLHKAAVYAHQLVAAENVPDTEVTISVYRAKKNEPFFKKWEERIIPTGTKGIYEVHGVTCFPFQIVIMSELEGRKFALLRGLSDKAEKKDLRQIIRDINREKDDQVKEYYETYVNLVAEKNPAVFSEIWEEKNMSDVLKEIMKDEFDKREQETNLRCIRNAMKNLQFSAEKAMDVLGIPQAQRPIYAALV